jgi:hypothetical protein
MSKQDSLQIGALPVFSLPVRSVGVFCFLPGILLGDTFKQINVNCNCNFLNKFSVILICVVVVKRLLRLIEILQFLGVFTDLVVFA